MIVIAAKQKLEPTRASREKRQVGRRLVELPRPGDVPGHENDVRGPDEAVPLRRQPLCVVAPEFSEDVHRLVGAEGQVRIAQREELQRSTATASSRVRPGERTFRATWPAKRGFSISRRIE